ncbi:MAG: hypothetical protein OHK0036_04200 [Bacteroidia bacterium]
MSQAVMNAEKIIIKPEITKAEIVLSANELESSREKQLKQIQKSISLPGFRPGKVPASIIKKKYSSAAFYEGFEDLLKNKTNEVLSSQISKPLYYVYDFPSVILDDGNDKKINIEVLLDPHVDIDIKDKEVELVKYGFTDNQRNIFSNIIIFFNFLKENKVEKLNTPDNLFVMSADVYSQNPDTEDKSKLESIPLFVHNYQYVEFALNEILPKEIESSKTYNIDLKKWIGALEQNFADKKHALIGKLNALQEKNIESVYLTINEIHDYTQLESNLDVEKVKRTLNIKDENTAINLEFVYSKLSEIIDIVADYFSGNENIKIGNDFINNLIGIEIPDDFIQKMYNTYVKEEDKKNVTIDILKREIISNIESNILKNLLPNTFNPSFDIEAFSTNVAKTYLVETLLTQMYLFDMESTKQYILYSIQTSNNENREHLLQNYHNRDSIFTFTQNLSNDVKVTYKTQNINQKEFYKYIGVKKDVFI